MAERIIKWFAFSIGLTILPVVFSLIFKMSFNINIQFSDYTNEFLFMAVTLSATSLGDVFSLVKKGVTGIHITIIFVSLIFISLICMCIYEIENIGNALNIDINNHIISVFTVVGCLASLIIGLVCQIFLEKVEGESA